MLACRGFGASYGVFKARATTPAATSRKFNPSRMSVLQGTST